MPQDCACRSLPCNWSWETALVRVPRSAPHWLRPRSSTRRKCASNAGLCSAGSADPGSKQGDLVAFSPGLSFLLHRHLGLEGGQLFAPHNRCEGPEALVDRLQFDDRRPRIDQILARLAHLIEGIENLV